MWGQQDGLTVLGHEEPLDLVGGLPRQQASFDLGPHRSGRPRRRVGHRQVEAGHAAQAGRDLLHAIVERPRCVASAGRDEQSR